MFYGIISYFKESRDFGLKFSVKNNDTPPMLHIYIFKTMLYSNMCGCKNNKGLYFADFQKSAYTDP